MSDCISVTLHDCLDATVASTVSGLQVTSSPKQKGNVDCGLYAGLQAEVVCQTVAGGGPDIADLQNRTGNSWFSPNDVNAARVLLRAAAVAWWTSQAPTTCQIMESEWTEAVADAQKAATEPLPTREAMWCASTTAWIIEQ